MPRLSNSLIRSARAEHPYLPLVLLGSRDLAVARDELLQLGQYVDELYMRADEHVREGVLQIKPEDEPKRLKPRSGACSSLAPPHLLDLCRQRALGKPVSYIRGSQPFGHLEMLCEKRVLIPRITAANYTLRIAELLTRRLGDVKAQLSDDGRTFSVLDLCTGSGCIPLLLHSLLAPHFPKLRIIGMELSDHALKLAKKNMAHNLRLGNLEPRAAREIVFMKHNILDEFPSELGDFDLVISNPPYATPDEYHSSAISKSVRCYEPVEALVPDETPNPDSVPGHTYFTAIDKIAQRTRAKAVIIEMGLEEQFAHVCSELQASPGYWSKVEVWRDQVYSGLLQREPQRELVVLDDGRGLRVHVHSLGIGFYRVVIGINKGWSWLNEQPDIVKSMDKAR